MRETGPAAMGHPSGHPLWGSSMGCTYSRPCSRRRRWGASARVHPIGPRPLGGAILWGNGVDPPHPGREQAPASLATETLFWPWGRCYRARRGRNDFGRGAPSFVRFWWRPGVGVGVSAFQPLWNIHVLNSTRVCLVPITLARESFTFVTDPLLRGSTVLPSVNCGRRVPVGAV